MEVKKEDGRSLPPVQSVTARTGPGPLDPEKARELLAEAGAGTTLSPT